MKPIQQWGRATKWGAAIVLLFLIGWTGSVIDSSLIVWQTATQMYQPVERLSSEPRQKTMGIQRAQTAAPPPPRVFLLLGVDRERTSRDKGRTDVIMLAIVNESQKKITLLSIPRDTYVEIAGQKSKDKINAAYRFGVDTTIATIENFTGVVIEHYVLFHFDGFVKVIDAMGGVELDLDTAVAQELHLPPGIRSLNGEQALEFARFRHDVAGDFGRNARHQQVVKAVLAQSKERLTPGAIEPMLDILGQNVKTDLTFSEMVSLASELRGFSAEQVDMLKYKASTARFGPQNLSYVIIDEQEQERVRQLLQQECSRP